MFPELIPTHYQGSVYRNIFTCTPSQNLLDDVCEEADYDLVDDVVQATSGIDHNVPQRKRVFQYGTVEMDDVLAVFKRERWNVGRFGDGLTYGVWYSAEDELTSVYEASWTSYQLAHDNILSRQEVYTTDRVMYQGHIDTEHASDLTVQKVFHEKLTQDDYGFCQSLGSRVRAQNIHLLRTPSARRPEGVCTPIFASDAIQEITYLYYLTFHILPNGMIHVISGHPKMNFSLHADQLRLASYKEQGSNKV